MLQTATDRPVDPLLLAILQRASEAAHSLGIAFFVGGALARDLVLWHVHGQRTGRATRDVDLGLHVNDWTAFSALKTRLVERDAFEPQPGTANRRCFGRPGHEPSAPCGCVCRRTGALHAPRCLNGPQPPVSDGLLRDRQHHKKRAAPARSPYRRCRPLARRCTGFINADYSAPSPSTMPSRRGSTPPSSRVWPLRLTRRMVDTPLD